MLGDTGGTRAAISEVKGLIEASIPDLDKLIQFGKGKADLT